MSYKITRGRVPPCRSEAITKPRPPGPEGSHITAPRLTKCIRKHPSRRRTKNPHAKPYSVCPPMNSLMIDVGGIAAISSGESATI